MSYQVFFSLSEGISKPLQCPKGTYQNILDHVQHIESALNLKRTKYLDNAPHWDHFDHKRWDKIDDKVICEEVANHNRWVRGMYEDFTYWFEHPFTIGKGHQDDGEGPNRAYPAGTKAETITPEQIKEVWQVFATLTVPPARWSRDYYRERMECLYEVMRGRPSEGIYFDSKPLTEKQAAAVITLFSEFLDEHDLRLDVPNDRDCLKSSYDGGYSWCEKCGAIDENDLDDRIRNCRKRKCPIKEEYGDEN